MNTKEPEFTPKPHFVAQTEGGKTLPLFVVYGKSSEAIPAFGRGQMSIKLIDAAYSPTELYNLDANWPLRVGRDPEEARKLVRSWTDHKNKFEYFVQFGSDVDRQKIHFLHEHTAAVSELCDSRLGVDTGELWAAFDTALRFEMHHAEYWDDPKREEHYHQHARKLTDRFEGSTGFSMASHRVIPRILRQIDGKASVWGSLSPIRHHPTNASEIESEKMINLFYSYSHKDEKLRDQLESHLALLRRQGFIKGWHDRKIGAGDEWKDSIDKNLEAAKVILLLVSSDFLNSDYCYDLEMKRAIELHDSGVAKVIPIVLRACDWTESPFGKLQALPTDAKAITSWTNRDEAFTDIAKGIRKAIKKSLTE